MAKLDWLFLPVDIDEDGEEDGVRRLRIRKLNRLHPQSNPVEHRSSATQIKPTPGSHRAKMKRSLLKQR
jgi:hypothetical protein